MEQQIRLDQKRYELFHALDDAHKRLVAKLNWFFDVAKGPWRNSLPELLAHSDMTPATICDQWTRDTQKAREDFLQAFEYEMEDLRPLADTITRLMTQIDAAGGGAALD